MYSYGNGISTCGRSRCIDEIYRIIFTFTYHIIIISYENFKLFVILNLTPQG